MRDQPQKIKTIIVEDEIEGMENIVIKLNNNCPEIEILEKCYTATSAIQAIERLNPDLIFLDVRLGGDSGFDVLSNLRHISFGVVFTTAYSEYAVDAFRIDAIDYLLKPIKPSELKRAVEKQKKRHSKFGSIRRISVPIYNGYQFISLSDIVYCLADDSYTKIYRNQESMILVTKTLKSIANKLPFHRFVRVSRSAIINIDYVDSFRRTNGGIVTMKNGDELSVSKDKRNELLAKITR